MFIFKITVLFLIFFMLIYYIVVHVLVYKNVFHVSGYFNYTYGQPGDSPVTKCFQIDYEPDISKEQIQVGIALCRQKITPFIC